MGSATNGQYPTEAFCSVSESNNEILAVKVEFSLLIPQPHFVLIMWREQS